MFSGNGAGTIGDPYQITSWAQLNEIRNHLSSHFVLMNDLGPSDAGYDIYASSVANSGAGWNPIVASDSANPFIGSLNGDGHTISGIFIDRTGVQIGLFGHASGEVRDLGLVDIDYTSDTTQAGGIIGASNNATATTVKRCFVSGSLTALGRMGAIVGNISSSTASKVITDCYSNVSLVTTGGSSGDNAMVSGILGRYWGGNNIEVRRCYSTCTFSGGLQAGIVQKATTSGGASTSFSNNFFDSTVGTSASGTNGSGTAKTTAQMQDIDTYTDTATAGLTNAWDMVAIGSYVDETWAIDDGNDYPILGFQVEVGDPTPTVTTQAVTSIDKTTATANGNVTDLGEEASVEAGHQFRVKNESAWTNTATQSLSATGAYTTSLTGLDPDTEYEVRSRITWDAGAEEAFGDVVEFTTDPLDAPTVTTQAATSVGSGGATLNGNVTSKGDFDPVDARFQYRETGSGTWLETSLATDAATGAYTFGLTGLTPETTYEFRAKVEYDTDQEVFGDTLEFTTLAGNTAPSVTTNAMTEVRATYATANGDVTSDGGETVTERGFVWATTTSPDVTDNKVEVAGTTGEYSVKLTALPPETLIYLRTYAINSEGTSYGNEVSFTTLSLEDVRNPVYIKDGNLLKRIS